MRYVSCASICFAMLFLFGCSDTSKPAPGDLMITHSSADHNFKVDMPGVPVATRKVTEESTQYTFAIATYSGTYSLTHYELAFVTSRDAESSRQLLQKLIDKTSKGGTQEYSAASPDQPTVNAIFHGEHISTGDQVRGRYLIAGDHIYELKVVGTKEQVNSATATKFLNSFQFVKPQLSAGTT